jgi:hypothetical protein
MSAAWILGWARRAGLQPVTARTQDVEDPGVRDNARLTSATGLLMFVPVLAVTLSGLYLDSLWRVHYFAGFVLLPLVAVKLVSTGYRAARYYLGDARYRRSGPPAQLLRVLAPVLAASTVVVLTSGVVMWAARSRLQPWSTLHTDAAVVFICVAAIHVLVYLPVALRTTRGAAAAAPTRARAGRRATVLGALAVGVVLAVATIPGSVFPHHEHGVGGVPGQSPPPATAGR